MKKIYLLIGVLLFVFSALLVVYVGNINSGRFECYGNNSAEVIISPDGYRCIPDLQTFEL